MCVLTQLNDDIGLRLMCDDGFLPVRDHAIDRRSSIKPSAISQLFIYAWLPIDMVCDRLIEFEGCLCSALAGHCTKEIDVCERAKKDE